MASGRSITAHITAWRHIMFLVPTDIGASLASCP